MLDVKVLTWPRKEDSLFMTVMAPILAARGQTLPPSALSDDGTDPPTVAPGQRLVVEYDDFSDAAARRFEAFGAAELAAAKKPLTGLAAFQRFASADFGPFRDFMLAWGDPAAPDNRIVIPRAGLRADPGPWLAWASGALDMTLQLQDGPLEETSEMVRRLGGAPVPTILTQMDVSQIDQLRRLMLDRETVIGIFLELLGRVPSDEGILRLQATTSADALRQTLMASEEYRRRMGAGS